MNRVSVSPPLAFDVALELAEVFASKRSRCLGVQLNQDAEECLRYWPLLAHTINNLGDPFGGGRGGHLTTFDAERELVQLVGDLLHLAPADRWGYFNPGSTYSNLHGVHLGMRRLRDPILVIADDAHYSLTKAALITRCRHVIVVRTNPKGQMDFADLRAKLVAHGPDNEYLFVFCSGSVAKCAYDDVAALLATIREVGVAVSKMHVHLDAALGGLITPFLRGEPLALDFSIPEIDSLSVSFHKRLGIPLPGSLFLARKRVVDNLPRSPFVDYVSCHDNTIGGSRDGLSPFITLHQLKRLGRDGMRQRTDDCLAKATALVEALRAERIDAWKNDHAPCVMLPAPSPELAAKYHLPIFRRGDSAFTHVFTFEHTSTEGLMQFAAEFAADCRS